MVMGSYDKMLRLWDLKNGVMSKEMEGHRGGVVAVVVSGDGRLMASGDDTGELIAWDGDTTESHQCHQSPLNTYQLTGLFSRWYSTSD